MTDSTQIVQADRTREGVVILLIGLFFFSFQDIIVKLLSDKYNVLQIVFIRTCIALMCLSVFGFITSGKQVFIAKQPVLLLLKGFATFFAFLFYYLAIPSLPLADIVAIAFMSPIVVTVLSVLLLKEEVRLKHWLAMLIGFAGMLIVVGPSGQMFNLGTLLAFSCACAYALGATLTRYIHAGDEPITIAIYSMAAFFIMSIVLIIITSFVDVSNSPNPSIQFLFRAWVVPNMNEALFLFAIGMIAAIGFYCLGRAYLVAPASHVAPFEYTYIIWAVILAYWVFQEVPKPTTLLGVLILVSSNLYLWHLRSNDNNFSPAN